MPQITAPYSYKNHLLNALPSETQDRISPYLEFVPLALGKVLYESSETMRYVYFPTDCIVSLLYVLENGATGEISVVGIEGFVGLALFLGGDNTLGRAVIQSEGYAYRLLNHRFKEEVKNHAELSKLLSQYIQTLITQMAQTAVCNRHHTIEQQLCRWLLLSLDRLQRSDLVMTQELIANMLGVRREGVTDAAGKLQRLGIIEYSRGHITVLDRTKLEALSCECYAVVHKETTRLLSYLPKATPTSVACRQY